MAVDARIYDNVVEIEVGVDTAIHAANDVLWQPVEVPLVANPNGCAILTSLVLADPDDQGIALDVIFLREPITVGANNATMTIADTALQHVLGSVPVAATDYVNLATNQVATVRNCGLVLLPDPSRSQSVWVTGRTSGTPTYAGGRLLLKIGVLRG